VPMSGQPILFTLTVIDQHDSLATAIASVYVHDDNAPQIILTEPGETIISLENSGSQSVTPSTSR
jgi:hypothetical protein